MGGASNGSPRAVAALLVFLALAVRAEDAPTTGAVASAGAALIPIPERIVALPGRLELATSAVLAMVASDAAAEAAKPLGAWLETHPGLVVRVASNAVPGAVPVQLRLRGSDAPSDPEGYRLVIRPEGVEIVARDVRGLRYGAVTLWQLIASHSTSTCVSIPAVEIHDAPRFRWRGLMLDSARHYQSADFIERLIDWMALHKLNVLHWHLTDDQGWRLQIRRYPRLTDIGAWRVPAGAARDDIDRDTGKPRLYGGYYSQETVRRLVRYAAERNITIVPEIEMPGHATAALVAYPELAAGEAPSEVPSDWGIYPNLFAVDGVTFTFLENMLVEVLELFPGQYIHIGGDEVVKEQWSRSARAQQWMREHGITDVDQLPSEFVARIGRFLAKHGRKLVGWDEILEGPLPPDATVMSWRGIDGARAAAQAGHDTVLAASPTLYFDHRQGAGAEEPPGRGRVIGLEEVYRFEPTITGLTAQERQHVLGLQGNLWTEHVRTHERVEWMAIPRAAAIAELGWSPADAREFTDFRARLNAATRWYRALGYGFATTEFSEPRPADAGLRRSQELETCSDRLVLNLEDDAPLAGDRAVFLIDILNPCWIYRNADLVDVSAVVARVGQLPFNFQIGEEHASIRLREPRTPQGELEVRVDDCDGEPAAVLPLAPAIASAGTTTLPAARLEPQSGRHDLCFSFTQRALDPIWALHSVELVRRTETRDAAAAEH